MSKRIEIKEIKSLFNNKIKERLNLKSVSFSYHKKNYENFKGRMENVSFKEKIDKAIINSVKNNSILKNFIYIQDQKEKIKKEKIENEKINNVKTHLNFTNLFNYLNLDFANNPFKYNIKKRKLEIEKEFRDTNKNKIKQIFLKRIFHDKKVKGKIDSGIKKVSEFTHIYTKIQNSIKKLEKIKLLKGKKTGIKSYATRENNKANINMLKEINKSNSLIINNTNFDNYIPKFYDLNNSSSINEKQNNNENLSFEPSLDYIINNDSEKTNKIHKYKSEFHLNIKKEAQKEENEKNSNKKPFNKLYTILKKSSIKNYNSIKNSKKIFNNNYKKVKLININEKNISEKLQKKYNSIIEDMFRKYNKIKINTDRLKKKYKMWHFSKYSEIDDIVNTKEDMLLFSLKQKYFKNQSFYRNAKKGKIKERKENSSLIKKLRKEFNRIEE